MTTFIVVGLAFTCTIGLFFGALVAQTFAERKVTKIIVMTVLAIIFGFGLSLATVGKYDYDMKQWNSGICQKCDEKLELFDVEYMRNNGREYWYKCSNGHVIRTYYYFSK